MDLLSLLCRLAAIVPAPRFHTIRYSGVLAPAAKWRRLIIPKSLPERRGDVVLRYDKRSVAHPDQMLVKDATVEREVIADAVRAISLLKCLPEVDGRRVYVVGHSLGAFLAPEIAARDGAVAGLVLLAPPGRPVPIMALEQLRASHATAAAIQDASRKINLLLAKQLRPDEAFLGVPAAYWIDLDRRDELQAARSLYVPIFVLHRGEDRQVTDEDLEICRRALAGKSNVRVQTFPALDHFMMVAREAAAQCRPRSFPALPASFCMDDGAGPTK